MLPMLLRRKNCATLFIFAACLFYFMWLFQLKTNSHGSHFETANHDLNINSKNRILLIKTTSPQIQIQTSTNDNKNKEFVMLDDHTVSFSMVYF
jgi:transcriptional antiterminator Rof (Rho-off)